MRGNHSFNRGPKSINGRIRSLKNLRNVGHKMFIDKDYTEQLYSDGMEYVSKRRKREAATLANQFSKQVKKNIVKKKVKDVDALKAWEALHDDNKSLDALSIEEAVEINNLTKERSRPKIPVTNGFKTSTPIRKNYGSMAGVWIPTGASDEDDKWYSNYAALQRSNKPIY